MRPIADLVLGKVLVVGSGGQVGSQIVRSLGSDAIPSTRTSGLAVDLGGLKTRRRDLTARIRAANVAAVLCVAGMTDVERCEAEPAMADDINVRGAATLANIAAGLSLPFVYFSTDYIFDGAEGPYTEDGLPRPLSAYGQSKWNGERAVRDAHPSPLVVRTTVVFGPDARAKNFAYTLVSALRAKRPLRVASDQMSTPTYNADLARSTVRLVRSGARGIFNVAGPETMSRFAFALRLASYHGLDATLIEPVATASLRQAARRPLRAGLVTGKVYATYPDLAVARNVEGALRDWKAAKCRQPVT